MDSVCIVCGKRWDEDECRVTPVLGGIEEVEYFTCEVCKEEEGTPEAKAETNVYLNILRREIADCSKEEIKEILLAKVGYWHASAIKWRSAHEHANKEI